MIDFKKIDKSWTLFLDRDGVINYEKIDDYIHTWEEFRFINGVKEAIAIFAKKFKYIIVVTNQRGIGRGITKQKEVERIHNNMVLEISQAGGRIDAVYYCADVDSASPNRKPNTGMGLQAVKDFPGIDLSKTIMVGNTGSDMLFGRNLGVKTIFLPTTRPAEEIAKENIDLVFKSLIDFANHLS
ncbi:MAG: HAD family hydrolase [Ferruginibacter sp.]|nr:HAD family hydrolase [Ferruginibacter sp.]